MKLAREHNVDASIQIEVAPLHSYPPEDIRVTTIRLLADGQTFEVAKSFGRIDNFEEIKKKIKLHIEECAKKKARK